MANLVDGGSPSLQIVYEPPTYRGPHEKGEYSYFRDRVTSQFNDDAEAKERLEAHAKEIEIEAAKLHRRMAEGVEYRVTPSRIDGTGGFFAPPRWVESAFATGVRPNRVLAAMIPNFYLPPGCASINVPRIVSGTRAEDQTDNYPPEMKDITDAEVASPAMTIAGQSDVALQLLEQSPVAASFDYAIMKDLRESYDFHLEEKLFTGEGTLEEWTGILFLKTGTKLASKTEYTAESPTGPAVFSKLGVVAAKLGDQRKMPPEIWMMRTSRWAWLGVAQDLNDLPLAVPGHQPPPPVPYLFDDSKPSAVSAILGWPIFCNDAIPAIFGAKLNQDVIVAARPTDSMLFESEERTSVMLDVLSGDLQARFQLFRYAAFLPRYPAGFSWLEGSGLTTETGF